MKIYVLKLRVDSDICDGGLSDVEVKCFTSLEKANLEMKKIFDEYKNRFAEEGCTEEDLDYNEFFSNKEFMISDGNDYYSGEIVESELK